MKRRGNILKILILVVRTDFFPLMNFQICWKNISSHIYSYHIHNSAPFFHDRYVALEEAHTIACGDLNSRVYAMGSP